MHNTKRVLKIEWQLREGKQSEGETLRGSSSERALGGMRRKASTVEREDEALKQSEKVISKYSKKFRCSADEDDDEKEDEQEDEQEDEVNQFSINLHLREDEPFSTFFPTTQATASAMSIRAI